MGIASLVLGLLGLLLSFVPCIGAYGLIFTIPGIVFGGIGIAKAAKANQGKGLAIAGLVLSIVGTGIAIWWCLCIGATAKAADDVSNAWDKTKGEIAESIDKLGKDVDKAMKDADNAMKDSQAELDKAQKELDSLNLN